VVKKDRNAMRRIMNYDKIIKLNINAKSLSIFDYANAQLADVVVLKTLAA